MKRKEKIDMLLSKVPADQKDAFIAELREAKTKEERLKVAEKFNATLTEEEAKAFAAESNKLLDEELDQAAGGCCSNNCECNCDCGCACHCSCSTM